MLALGSGSGDVMIDWIPVKDITTVAVGEQTREHMLRAGSMSGLRRGASRKEVRSERRSPTSFKSGRSENALNLNVFEPDPDWADTGIDNGEDEEGILLPDPTHFDVHTISDGHNNGRVYHFRTDSEEATKSWVEAIKQALDNYERAQREDMACGDQIKSAAHKLLDMPAFQTFYMLCILLSFLLSVIGAEINPPTGPEHTSEDPVKAKAFAILDDIFTGLFTIELIVNMVAFWFKEFFDDGWRVFDLVAVTGSLISAIEADVPAFHPLRAVRVLRAVRILGRSGSFKAIVHAMIASIMPVMHSVSLLGLVTCIFAVMGNGFFAQEHPMLFGTFTASFFTMFQACTGDAWASGVVRTMFDDATGAIKPLPAIFFMLYMIICYLMLVNIVVAVLLDEFLTTMTACREQEKRQEALEAEAQPSSLEPLAKAMANFASLSDLKHSIGIVFRRLDIDMNGSIGMREFRDGLRKMADIYISVEDWENLCKPYMSSGVSSGDAEQQLTVHGFQRLMVDEVKMFALRSLNRAVLGGENFANATLLAVKWLLISMPVDDDTRWIESDSLRDANLPSDEAGVHPAVSADKRPCVLQVYRSKICSKHTCTKSLLNKPLTQGETGCWGRGRRRRNSENSGRGAQSCAQSPAYSARYWRRTGRAHKSREGDGRGRDGAPHANNGIDSK